MIWSRFLFRWILIYPIDWTMLRLERPESEFRARMDLRQIMSKRVELEMLAVPMVLRVNQAIPLAVVQLIPINPVSGVNVTAMLGIRVTR